MEKIDLLGNSGINEKLNQVKSNREQLLEKYAADIDDSKITLDGFIESMKTVSGLPESMEEKKHIMFDMIRNGRGAEVEQILKKEYRWLMAKRLAEAEEFNKAMQKRNGTTK